LPPYQPIHDFIYRYVIFILHHVDPQQQQQQQQQQLQLPAPEFIRN